LSRNSSALAWLNTIGGFRNEMTFVLTGLDIEAKADLVRRQLRAEREVADGAVCRANLLVDLLQTCDEHVAEALLRRDVGRALS